MEGASKVSVLTSPSTESMEKANKHSVAHLHVQEGEAPRGPEFPLLQVKKKVIGPKG